MDAGVKTNPSIYPVEYTVQTPLNRSKMAVFDIDDTLFDSSQRVTNAIRAGVGPTTPYTGDRKSSDYPKGKKAFMKFFNDPKQFRADSVTPGAVEYVRSLANKGYTIAYCSGRTNAHIDATIEHLKQSGFPVFKNSKGETLVYLKPMRAKTAKFKYDTMRRLQASYTIDYFFDDLHENREVAHSLNVIGVYDLRDRLGVLPNPRRNVPAGDQPPDSRGVSLKTLIEKGTNRPLNPQAKYPLKREYYQAVLKSNKPLPGEFIILGGAAIRRGDDEAQEAELRSLGWSIAGQTPGEFFGDLNVGRQEKMSHMRGSPTKHARGLYVHRGMFGPGFKSAPNNRSHPIYSKAGIASIQFRPRLAMTNYNRVLYKRGNGPFEVMFGDIAQPDPVTGAVGIPRTKFSVRAEAFFYGSRNPAGMTISTKIDPYEYPNRETFFYWPMRLPSKYLDTTASPTEIVPDDADGGMFITLEEHQSTVRESLPPGLRHLAKDNPHKVISQIDGGHPQGKPGVVFHLTNVPEGYREAAGCMVQRASDGKVLFLRRSKKETSKHGMYEFPGGKLEEGETVKEAALIETKEEAGLDVKIIRQLNSHVDHTKKKVYHCFLAVPKKGARVTLSFEHDDYKWCSLNKKWSNKKLSHHARYMINQMHGVRSNGLFGFGKKAKDVKGRDSNGFTFSLIGGSISSSSGSAYNEYPTSTNINNDYIEVKYAGVHPDWLEVDFGEGPKRYQGPIMQWKIARKTGAVEVQQGSIPQSQIMSKSERQAKIDALGPRPSPVDDSRGFNKHLQESIKISTQGRRNPPVKSKILPIMSGEPSGKHKKLGAVFAEVVIGRNVVKDVGEAVQGIYRGLIGGRTSMAEKRMAMGVASMQKELSDRAQSLGGNAVCNLKIDYEMIQGTATISIIAHADAIKMTRPPKNNPRKPLDGMEDKKMKKAKRAYKKFHGGKEPTEMVKETIDVGDVWYALGPCWSIGYKSPKETGEDDQKYIHHTNEDSKDGNYPMMYATMPENGEPMIVIKGGSMKIGMRDGLAWLID